MARRRPRVRFPQAPPNLPRPRGTGRLHILGLWRSWQRISFASRGSRVRLPVAPRGEPWHGIRGGPDQHAFTGNRRHQARIQAPWPEQLATPRAVAQLGPARAVRDGEAASSNLASPTAPEGRRQGFQRFGPAPRDKPGGNLSCSMAWQLGCRGSWETVCPRLTRRCRISRILPAELVSAPGDRPGVRPACGLAPRSGWSGSSGRCRTR